MALNCRPHYPSLIAIHRDRPYKIFYKPDLSRVRNIVTQSIVRRREFTTSDIVLHGIGTEDWRDAVDRPVWHSMALHAWLGNGMACLSMPYVFLQASASKKSLKLLIAFQKVIAFAGVLFSLRLNHSPFLPRDAMHSTDYAVARCISVRLSHAGIFCRNG